MRNIVSFIFLALIWNAPQVFAQTTIDELQDQISAELISIKKSQCRHLMYDISKMYKYKSPYEIEKHLNRNKELANECATAGYPYKPREYIALMALNCKHYEQKSDDTWGCISNTDGLCGINQHKLEVTKKLNDFYDTENHFNELVKKTKMYDAVTDGNKKYCTLKELDKSFGEYHLEAMYLPSQISKHSTVYGNCLEEHPETIASDADIVWFERQIDLAKKIFQTVDVDIKKASQIYTEEKAKLSSTQKYSCR